MSYYLIEQKIAKHQDTEMYWKNYLSISNRPLYDAIYNPEESESDVIDEAEVLVLEEGYDDPSEIDAILRSMSGQLSMTDNRLLVNDGEWQ